METAVGFGDIMPKPNIKTRVTTEQSSKYICARLISSSFPNWRKEHRKKTLDSLLVFCVSISEVNVKSINFQIVYIYLSSNNLTANHTRYN